MFYPRNSHQKLTNKPKILLLVLLGTLLTQLGIDLYLPAMPAMASALQASHRQIQLSLTAYMLGYGLAQLAFGYIADRWGRRPALLIGYLLFFIASLAIVQWQAIAWFLLFRLIQGLGTAATSVVLRCTARDLFSGKQLSKALSYISAIWAFVPIAAPIIGAYLLHFFGWLANFQLLLLLSGLILLLTWKLLPETQQTKPQTNNIFITMLFHHARKFAFWRSSLAALSCSALIFAYLTASPFLLQVHYGLSAIQFAWIAFALACCSLLGALLNNYLLPRLTETRLIAIGLSLIIMASLSFLYLSYLPWHSLAMMLLPLALLFIGDGICYPNLAAIAFRQFDRFAGIGAAMFGSLMAAGVAFVSLIVAHLDVGYPHFLAWLLLLLTVILTVTSRGKRQ